MKITTAILVVAAALVSSTPTAEAFNYKQARSAIANAGRPSSSSSSSSNSNNGMHELKGEYCGSYMAGMVSGKVKMQPSSSSETPSTFDLNVKAFGNAEAGCTAIVYKLEEKTGRISVPDSDNPTSCLGQMLASGGLVLDVAFDARKDSVSLDLGVGKLSLSHC